VLPDRPSVEGKDSYTDWSVKPLITGLCVEKGDERERERKRERERRRHPGIEVEGEERVCVWEY
jgi:hypothetical protein